VDYKVPPGLSSVNADRADPAVRSPSGKHRTKTGFAQDAGDLRALVPLNFDPSFLDRAARATGLLHRFGEFFLLRQTDADETSDDRYRLATAMRRLSQDIHPAAILPGSGTRGGWLAAGPARLIFRSGRQALTAQPGERLLPEALTAIDGYALVATHGRALFAQPPAGRNS